jgi:predicted AlkP superfamily phosphohydrolase/phosphomutase
MCALKEAPLSQNNKVLVIGLDGASFDFIDTFRQEGRLPHIDSLIKNGVRATLKSTIPPNSAAAWPSFFTGQNPGKHGIFHFFNFRGDRYEPKLIDSRDIQSPRIWDLMGEQDLKSIVINVPITYPPQEINGLMVSGMLTPSEETILSYPPSLHTELIAQTGFWPLEKYMASLKRAGKDFESLDLLYRATETQLDVLLYLMKKYDWDFFLTVFRGTDLVQHLLMRPYLERASENVSEEILKLSHVIPQFYEKVDEAVGKLIENAPDDTRIILMSDHGCGPIYGLFALNRWLHEEGLLRLKKGARLRKLKSSLVWMPLGKIMDKLGLEKEFLKGNALSIFLRTKWPILRRQVEESWQIINWPKTKVYGSLGGDSMILLRLNLEGREPDGVIAPGQEEKDMKSLLKEKLLGLCHPSTGEPMVEKVYEAGEIYSGTSMKFAPDLVGIFRNYEYIAVGKILKKHWLEETYSGQHRMEGILVMAGEDLRKGVEIPDCEIIDLAPTILHLMGVAIPSDLDGRVIKEAIRPEFSRKHPIRYRDPQEKRVGKGILDVGRDQKDEQDIVDLLKGLGYID